MKYLDKSFSLYFSRPASKVTRTERKPVNPKHRYADLGGMCSHCALSREGHRSKYEKR